MDRTRWGAAVALAAFVLLRMGMAFSAEPREFNDSADYRWMSGHSVADILAGGLTDPLGDPTLERKDGGSFPFVEKPPGTALLWKVTSEDTLVPVQALLGALAWGWLAIAAGAMWTGRWARATAFGGVLLVGLAGHVTVWDTALLSDSLSMSAMAATLAGLLALSTRWTWWRFAAWTGAAVVFAITRDLNAYLLAIVGAAALVVAWRSSDRRWMAPAFVALGVLLLMNHTAGVGHRELVPAYHLISFRILPNPEATEEMASRGMPVSDRLKDMANHNVQQDDFATSPDLSDFHQWMVDSGHWEYRRWAATHPRWALEGPVRDLRLVREVVRGYEPDGYVGMPPTISRGVVAGYWVTMAAQVALVGLALVVLRRDRRTVMVLGGLLITAGAVLLGNWHGDGLEFARHAKEAVVLVAIAAVLSVAGLVQHVGDKGAQR